MNMSDLVRKYLKLREAKAELEAKHKEETSRFTKAMQKIETTLLSEFTETGQESAKTPHGTAYVSVRTSAKVADRDAFLDFVRDNQAWDFVESRVSKKAVEDYVAEHEELPSGVNVTRSMTVNIRRS
jgi:nanoRNase/pAp phosphatase (c-di-AMP/oligoRNAs hydrolase)